MTFNIFICKTFWRHFLLPSFLIRCFNFVKWIIQVSHLSLGYDSIKLINAFRTCILRHEFNSKFIGIGISFSAICYFCSFVCFMAIVWLLKKLFIYQEILLDDATRVQELPASNLSCNPLIIFSNYYIFSNHKSGYYLIRLFIAYIYIILLGRSKSREQR